jgi:hypothetical protein
MRVFLDRIFGKTVPLEPKRDWIATGTFRWATIKEGGGFKRQQLQEKDVDMNTGEERWCDEGYDIAYYGSVSWKPVQRLVGSGTSDDYTGYPPFNDRPRKR